jgi:hypothetical protein
MALQHENRRLQDKLDSQRMRGEYNENANLWAKFKQWRSRKAAEGDRMASAACVGVFKGEPVPDSAWEPARERERERERARRAAEAK